jgi:HPt (histidine-containing phosphotransfer) domain-containing protein
MAGAKEEYLAAGMDDYLSKPIDNSELFARLSKVRARLFEQPESPPGAADRVPPVAIDAVRLEMIAEVMADDATLAEFVEVFLCNAAERIAQISRLLDTVDLQAAGREAHTLLGTAGNFGAFCLSEPAADLRRACDMGDADRAREVAAELKQAWRTASEAIRDWLDRKTAPRAA